MTTQQSLNIPQLLVLGLIAFLIIRWFFNSSSSQQSSPHASANGHGSRVNPAHVEQLLQMFPQLDRRTVIWELQRNGGNVAAVTEKVLSGGALSTPPQSFQPPLPATPATQNTSAPGRPGTNAQSKSAHPDLITKYNLSSKLTQDAAASSDSATAQDSDSVPEATKRKAWSTNKAERQALLQKRREDMILKARRTMEEKDRNVVKS